MKSRGAESLVLGGILVAAPALRLPGIGWGPPPPVPRVVASGIRCSYAFDQDDLLTSVSFTRPSQLDFDMRSTSGGVRAARACARGLEPARAYGFTTEPSMPRTVVQLSRPGGGSIGYLAAMASLMSMPRPGPSLP